MPLVVDIKVVSRTIIALLSSVVRFKNGELVPVVIDSKR